MSDLYSGGMSSNNSSVLNSGSISSVIPVPPSSAASGPAPSSAGASSATTSSRGLLSTSPSVQMIPPSGSAAVNSGRFYSSSIDENTSSFQYMGGIVEDTSPSGVAGSRTQYLVGGNAQNDLLMSTSGMMGANTRNGDSFLNGGGIGGRTSNSAMMMSATSGVSGSRPSFKNNNDYNNNQHGAAGAGMMSQSGPARGDNNHAYSSPQYSMGGGDSIYNSSDYDGAAMSYDSSMNGEGADEVAAAAFEAVLRSKNLDGSATGNECNLYIKNIDYDISDEVLYTVFSHIGEITSHHIVRDGNNRSRGFGFMSFRSPDQAKRSIVEMNGRFLGKKPIVVMLHIRKEQRRILKHMMKGPDTVVIGGNHEQLLAAATGGMLSMGGKPRGVSVGMSRGSGPNSGPVGPLFIDNPTAMRLGGATGRGLNTSSAPGSNKSSDAASMTAEIIGQLSQIRQLQLDLVTNQQLEIHQASQGAVKPNSKYEDERKRQQRQQQQQFIDFQLQKVIDSLQQLRVVQSDRFESMQQQHVAISAVAHAAYRQGRPQSQQSSQLPGNVMYGGGMGTGSGMLMGSSSMMMQQQGGGAYGNTVSSFPTPSAQQQQQQQQRTMNGFQISEPISMGNNHSSSDHLQLSDQFSGGRNISQQYSYDSYHGGNSSSIGELRLPNSSGMAAVGFSSSTSGSSSPPSQYSMMAGDVGSIGDGSDHGDRAAPNRASSYSTSGLINDRSALKEHLFNLVRDRGHQKSFAAEAIANFLLTNASTDELMQVIDNPGSLLPQYVSVALNALDGDPSFSVSGAAGGGGGGGGYLLLGGQEQQDHDEGGGALHSSSSSDPHAVGGGGGI